MLDKNQWQALLKKAKSGEASAQYEVGYLYSEGYKNSEQKIIVKQDNKLAFQWYEKAAKQENVDGICSLAYYLDVGIGCKRNIRRAIKLYNVGVDMGSSTAAANLGTIFRDKGNYEKAFQYYMISMRLDRSDYSFTVGLCYYYGIGVDENKSIAIRHFRKVCEDKLTLHNQYERDQAHYYLGLAYLTGEGLKKSLKLARKHFEVANTDNDNECALQLLYLIGRNSN